MTTACHSTVELLVKRRNNMFQKLVAYFTALLFVIYPSISYAGCQDRTMMEQALRAEGYPEEEIEKAVSGLENIERDGELYLSPDQFVEAFTVSPESISDTWKHRRKDAVKAGGGTVLVLIAIAGAVLTAKLWVSGGASGAGVGFLAKATAFVTGTASAIWAKLVSVPYLGALVSKAGVKSLWVVEKVNGLVVKPLMVPINFVKGKVVAAVKWGGAVLNWIGKGILWISLFYSSVATGSYGSIAVWEYGGLVKTENLTLKDIEDHFAKYMNDYVYSTTGTSKDIGTIVKVKLTDKEYIIKSMRSLNGRAFYTKVRKEIDKPYFAYQRKGKTGGRKYRKSHLISTLSNRLVPVESYAWFENYIKSQNPGSQSDLEKAVKVVMGFLPRNEEGNSYSNQISEGKMSEFQHSDTVAEIDWAYKYEYAVNKLELLIGGDEDIATKKQWLREVFNDLRLVAGNLACR